MDSPFQYGKLVVGPAFIKRIKEKQEIKDNLYSGINTILISPRRMGKSSLIKAAMGELQKEHPDVKVCYLNVFTVRSEEEFYRLFARTVLQTTGESWKFGISETLDSLDLPEQIAEEKNIRLIVCIDEFQNLEKLRDYENLEKKMRKVWQKQTHVSYCLCGSNSQTMIDLFNTRAKPFYRFGSILFLSRISEKEWLNFVISSFGNTGKNISVELASELVDIAGKHSWYVQQLAHFVWNLTVDFVTSEIIQKATKQVIEANLPMFQNLCEDLPVTQLNLLVAIADGAQALTSVAAMSKYNLGTPHNVSKNKLALQKRDLIEKTPKGFVFIDPIFERWFVSLYL
jgi:hypothetical protein